MDPKDIVIRRTISLRTPSAALGQNVYWSVLRSVPRDGYGGAPRVYSGDAVASEQARSCRLRMALLPIKRWLFGAVLCLCLATLGLARGEGLPSPSPVERALSREPFIGEAEDAPGTLPGFPDPYVFRWGAYFYVCQSVVDTRNARMYRTTSFEKGDLTRFDLSFDFGPTGGGPRQVWGFKPYVHTDGAFHAYGSIHYGDFQTEVVHFVPAEGEVWTENNPIQKWRVKKILLGEKELGGKIAYDGFCIRDDDGSLYLLVNESMGARNYITARLMLTPNMVDPTFSRRILLGPDEYRSEDLPWSLRLTEGTFVTKIQGEYVLVYSVGFFADNSYKVGVAFSDALIPAKGEQYKKVLIPDPAGVWGNAGKDVLEVKYLLQSQQRDWPNYAGHFVNGPGIGSIVKLPGGYRLIFAARRPCSHAKMGLSRYVWCVPLRVNISDETPMTRWLEVVLPK